MVQHAYRNVKCLACPEGQKKFARQRGLCLPCYATALASVLAGRTTWAALVQEGRANATAKELAPAGRGGQLEHLFAKVPVRRPGDGG